MLRSAAGERAHRRGANAGEEPRSLPHLPALRGRLLPRAGMSQGLRWCLLLSFHPNFREAPNLPSTRALFWRQGSSAAGAQTIRLVNAQAVYLISHGSGAAEGALYRQIWQSYCQGLFNLIAVPHYWQTSIPVHERCRLFYSVPYGSHLCSPEFDLARYLN